MISASAMCHFGELHNGNNNGDQPFEYTYFEEINPLNIHRAHSYFVRDCIKEISRVYSNASVTKRRDGLKEGFVKSNMTQKIESGFRKCAHK